MIHANRQPDTVLKRSLHLFGQFKAQKVNARRFVVVLAILIFVGIKMLLLDVYKIPIWLSIAVIATTITVAVVWSLRATRETASPSQDQARTAPEQEPHDATN